MTAWGSVFGPNFRRGVSIPKSQLLPEPTISIQYTIALPFLRYPLPCTALLELALLCHCLALLGSKDKPKYVLKKRSTRQAEARPTTRCSGIFDMDHRIGSKALLFHGVRTRRSKAPTEPHNLGWFLGFPRPSRPQAYPRRWALRSWGDKGDDMQPLGGH